MTAEVLETTNKKGTSQRLHQGAALSKEDYTDAQWASISGSVAAAYVVTSTVQLSKTEFMYRNSYLTASEISALKTAYPSSATEIDKAVQAAYYCTEAGKYGGNYYETGHNYRALAAYSAMSPEDRDNFTFNYDALDLLIDPNYSRAEGVKYQYDGEGYDTPDEARQNKAKYSLQTPIDYTATYKGSSLSLSSPITVKHKDGTSGSVTSVVEGDELTRVDFETLPNERQYYSAITAEAGKTYYVVKQDVVMGNTPYAAGQVITSETYADLSDTDKAKVTTLTFTTGGNYFYCHEGYTINTSDYSDENKGKVKTAAGVTIDGTPVTADQQYSTTVPAGTVIDINSYNDVINNQKNFAIHGQAPTETSTLYVTRGADIYDLSAEKIITVIYKYDYVESDMDGMHITPVTEYHVLNIHINFQSGVPTVEDILPPDIILPGTSLSMPEPYVTPGAYEITGGGWKLFDTESDAESHINGVEYTNSIDPLYLYQHGHYLAYYAKSYLGETYSNHVPVSVANYHDIKKVMNATDHHYYIDHQEVHERLKVEPKIYINDYSGDAEGSKNGLDLFKDIYDLSLVNATGDGYTVTDGKITGATGGANTNLVGHNTLNERVKGANKLEFFMRTDIDYPDNPESDDWASIGTEAQCFEGTLHGDGHTIRGLDHSLFNNLCGSVYNLGVTGSFNEAGVVNKGSGYVESTWVKTTNNTSLGTKPYAVFGNPTDGSGYQVVNSYFWDGNNNLYNTSTTNGVTTSGGDRGTARAMSAKEFYNGTVAYDLNNFYLYKRYSDQMVTSGTDKQKYSYFTIDNDGKLVLQNNHYYTANADLCSSGYADEHSNVIMYVEERFKDGDFRYAGGTIPEEEDERFHSWTVTDPTDSSKKIEKSGFFPIWPDDYIFFGQKLTYGWSVTEHQEVPTAVARNEGRLSKLSNANRVYRAPAYFRSKEMGAAHFNPDVYLAQYEKLTAEQIAASATPCEAYPGLTAIDFADHRFGVDDNYKTYEKGLNHGWFYQPLLDDDGLLSIINCDETRNLLVYAPAESATTGYANKATYDVLTGYFTDPAYGDYYNIEGKPEKYRTVADATSTNAAIYGHLVKSNLKATNDHLLVDKEDFNCPIAYQFDGTHRMWYQRKPEDHEYVDFTKGWQGISIPFTAELVTTDDKGEITHFYSGSETSKNGTGTKIGHEYWLREFKSISEEGTAPDVVAKASFLYPTAMVGSSKSVENTFLWDYYYENTAVHNQKDENKDTYQTYYKKSRNYSGYPLLAAATPYILGLPGETYYEFDLSGNFEAQHTAVTIDKLGRQTVSFVSNTGIGIDVSDDETAGVTQSLEGTNKNYSLTFKPSYMNENLTAGTNNYTLDIAGDSYDKVPTTGAATKVSAFRPYFTATVTTTNSPKMIPERILFGNDYSGLEGEPIATLDGNLEINVEGHKIVATSHLKNATTVRIINVSGVSIANYVIQPGETVETPVSIEGVYIANKRKLLVK